MSVCLSGTPTCILVSPNTVSKGIGACFVGTHAAPGVPPSRRPELCGPVEGARGERAVPLLRASAGAHPRAQAEGRHEAREAIAPGDQRANPATDDEIGRRGVSDHHEPPPQAQFPAQGPADDTIQPGLGRVIAQTHQREPRRPSPSLRVGLYERSEEIPVPATGKRQKERNQNRCEQKASPQALHSGGIAWRATTGLATPGLDHDWKSSWGGPLRPGGTSP